MIRFLKIALVVSLALVATTAVRAQFPSDQTMKSGPVSIGTEAPEATHSAQSLITPVQAPEASFSAGTAIADVLGSLVAVFGSVIATFLTKWVMALAKKAGVEASQALSDRLDQIILNGLHAGAAVAKQDLTGKLNVQVKNEVIAKAVTYAQDHGAETIKGISGLNVDDPLAVEALQARATKVLSTIGPEVVLAPVVPAVAAQVAS